MSSDVTTEKLVDAKTISQMLDISKRSFWRYRAQGKIGPKEIKIGGNLRWKLSAILKWIEWGCCDAADFQKRLEAEKC